MIVVACNTATTAAIDDLRNTYSIPFIGIEPAIKPAALKSVSNKVGVLATKGTLASRLFAETSSRYADKIDFIEVTGTGLVELIEAGKATSPETIALLKIILEPVIEAGVDFLVLGCSHYPYLIPALRNLLPDHINIIDSGEAVAAQTHRVLLERGLLNDSGATATHQLFTNTETDVLASIVSDVENTRISYLLF